MCLAVPGQILTIRGEDPLRRNGRVCFGGIIKEANLAFVPEAQPGDYVIVHAGFALSTLNESEAERALADFRQMDELTEF